MLHPRTAVPLVLVLLLLGSPAKADMIFHAFLTHSQETPPTPDRGFSGFATFTLNDAMTTFTFTATVFGLDVTGSQTPDTTDNLVAAHIHGGAGPGASAAVVFGFFGMFETPCKRRIRPAGSYHSPSQIMQAGLDLRARGAHSGGH